MSADTPSFRFVSTNRRVREDRRFVAGHGHFVADVALEGLLHVAILPSQHPAARIVSIDTSAALAMPGVHYVLTGDELAAATDPLMNGLDTPKVQRHPLAVGQTRYAGEWVVAVVADTRALAEDATEKVRVIYEPLPFVMKAEEALKPDSPPVHPAHGSNVLLDLMVDGKAHLAMPREIQRDHIHGKLIHVDFLAVSRTETITVDVEILEVGDAPGVKEGGVVEHHLRQLIIECLPQDVPEHIEADISGLSLGDMIHVRDLVPPKGVTILTNADDAVLSVITPAALRTEAELLLPGEEAPEVPVEAEAEAAEAAEGAEGEAAPGAAEEGGEG